jgi:hypothetical protein
MRRGTIKITDHAVTRFQQRAGLNIPVEETKRRIQQIYDKGKFILAKESTDKMYKYTDWVIVVRDLAVITCYMPPVKENKGNTYFWINRNWITF